MASGLIASLRSAANWRYRGIADSGEPSARQIYGFTAYSFKKREAARPQHQQSGERYADEDDLSPIGGSYFVVTRLAALGFSIAVFLPVARAVCGKEGKLYSGLPAARASKLRLAFGNPVSTRYL